MIFFVFLIFGEVQLFDDLFEPSEPYVEIPVHGKLLVSQVRCFG